MPVNVQQGGLMAAHRPLVYRNGQWVECELRVFQGGQWTDVHTAAPSISGEPQFAGDVQYASYLYDEQNMLQEEGYGYVWMSNTGKYLVFQSWDFASKLPEGKAVRGLVVNVVQAKTPVSAPAGAAVEMDSVELRQGTTRHGQARNGGTLLESTSTFRDHALGSETDGWGVADLNTLLRDASFNLRLHYDMAASGTMEVRIKKVTITLYY